MILLFLFAIITIIILIIKNYKQQKIIKDIVNNSSSWLIDKTKEQTDKQIKLLEKQKAQATIELNKIEENIKKQNEINEQIYNYQTTQLERQVTLLKAQKQQEVNHEVDIYKRNKLTVANQELDKELAQLNERRATVLNEISQIELQLEDYRKKQEAINARILHEEQLKLQEEAHRIILSPEDKEDILYLDSIAPKLRNKEILYKLIWSEYLQKPFNKMVNGLFGSKVPKNVIYCIEQINGDKKYIGKTKTEVSKRWTEHIKTSLSIGGVARSQIHDALYLHWDEFYFSVLEVLDDDSKLSEREKYYIKFYETDKIGFNQKGGG